MGTSSSSVTSIWTTYLSRNNRLHDIGKVINDCKRDKNIDDFFCHLIDSETSHRCVFFTHKEISFCIIL